MKAIIVALAFVALAYGQDDKVETQFCTPGSTRKIECNNCFCLEDGSGWACTLMGCDSQVLTIAREDSTSEPEAADSSKRSRRDVENIQVCEPGATKNVDCNSCFCTNDGSGWACTRKGCIHRTVAVEDSGPDTTAATKA